MQSKRNKLQALILAAGKGTRMYSSLPKVLHPIWERPLLGHILDTLQSLDIRRPCVVVGYGAPQVKKFLALQNKKNQNSAPSRSAQKKKIIAGSTRTVLQNPQKGTGHAVMAAAREIKNAGQVLIWPGDMPLVKKETLQKFLKEHRMSNAAASVLTCRQPNPFGYGRIVRLPAKQVMETGEFVSIREEVDASESEKKITEVNTGIYLFDRKALFAALAEVQPNNQKGEYYLTDTIEILRAQGRRVQACCLAGSEEALGVNSKRDLAMAARVLTDNEIDKHLAAGVSVISPKDTWIAPHVKIGTGTVIYPWTWIDSGVIIGSNCQIGPFAKIRGGSKIGNDSIIGNFVEINRSQLGRAVFAKHLTYLGDAIVGDQVNFGAGAITANFDGKNKHTTRVGKQALVGSNTVMVAPVNIPNRVKTGAGSVVTKKTKMRAGDVIAGVPAKLLK